MFQMSDELFFQCRDECKISVENREESEPDFYVKISHYFEHKKCK